MLLPYPLLPPLSPPSPLPPSLRYYPSTRLSPFKLTPTNPGLQRCTPSNQTSTRIPITNLSLSLLSLTSQECVGLDHMMK